MEINFLSDGVIHRLATDCVADLDKFFLCGRPWWSYWSSWVLTSLVTLLSYWLGLVSPLRSLLVWWFLMREICCINYYTTYPLSLIQGNWKVRNICFFNDWFGTADSLPVLPRSCSVRRNPAAEWSNLCNLEGGAIFEREQKDNGALCLECQTWPYWLKRKRAQLDLVAWTLLSCSVHHVLISYIIDIFR